jgi:molybdenum cofactor cytidylyltransferase
MSELWAIILAAGESKRMKVPKLLLPYNGKTIIECVIENVIGSEVDKTVVVLGAYNEEILKVAGLQTVKICYNENYMQGMLTSVKCGFNFLPQNFAAALVFLGDQPWIRPDIINLVISAYRATGKGIIMPSFNSKRGHPLLIDSKYRDEISKLEPVRGLRALSMRFPSDVLEVETKSSEILKDIDTFEDYFKGLNQTD